MPQLEYSVFFISLFVFACFYVLNYLIMLEFVLSKIVFFIFATKFISRKIELNLVFVSNTNIVEFMRNLLLK
jgi:hypothetical protein